MFVVIRYISPLIALIIKTNKNVISLTLMWLKQIVIATKVILADYESYVLKPNT